MLTLKVHGNKGSKGCFGRYVKLGKGKGVKLLHGQCESLKELKNSDLWEAATEEAYLLRKAFKSGVVPRCYGVVPVKTRKGYRVGIILQHLGDITLAKIGDRIGWDTVEIVSEMLSEKLLEVGVEHGDLHCSNIMRHKGKYYAIDFSPECSYEYV
jgi:tRNA A-37 threonylcarbamoyl transferase component Bud32